MTRVTEWGGAVNDVPVADDGAAKCDTRRGHTSVGEGELGANGAPALGMYTEFASGVLGDALLKRYFLQSWARKLLPADRVANCMRIIVPGKRGVDLVYSEVARRANYRNLCRCGSVWTCAVCSTLITERRRVELTQAVNVPGYVVAMGSYTLRHHARQGLAELLPVLLEAFRFLKSGRPFQRLVAAYSWVGSVRSLEVTYGDNGWHPHIHELIFFTAAPDLAALQHAMRLRWSMSLDKLGGSASYEHGLDVRERYSGLGVDQIAEYVAKFGRLPHVSSWTVEQEITKQPVKKGREGGFSPLELVAAAAAGEVWAGERFQEYARVFKGRSQLQWSRGLRDLLGINKELTDAEVVAADEARPVDRVLRTLLPAEWDVVLRSRAQAALLIVAQSGDVDRVQEFLSGLGVYDGETV